MIATDAPPIFLKSNEEEDGITHTEETVKDNQVV